MTHPDESRIQDYLDDLLCREERAELETHLAQCAQCNAFVLSERELRRALSELPRSIEPSAHVLQAINERIDAQPLRAGATATRKPWSQRTLGSLRVPLAAAALLLIALTATMTQLLTRPARAPAASAAATHAVLAAEPRYTQAARELEAVLAPETEPLVRAPLDAIDRALAEARAALAREPDNAALAELLRAAHEQKLELLRQATRSRAGT